MFYGHYWPFIAIIGLFHCDPCRLPTQKWLWVATNDISIRNFTTACHTTTHNTVAPYPFAPLHLVLPAPLDSLMTPKI